MRPFWLRSIFDNKSTRRPLARKSLPQLRIENLEPRDVPAVIDLTGGVLTYTAGAGVNNSASVSISGGNFVVTDAGETIDPSGVSGATVNNPNSINVPTAGVTSVVLNLGDGTDAIATAGAVVADQTLTISNTGTSLSIGGPVRTAPPATNPASTGNIVITGTNQVSLTNGAQIGGTVTSAGNVAPTSTYTIANQTTGTVSISANTDGTGTEGFNQGGGWIITNNTTAAAAAVTVGGTGDATIGLAAVGSTTASSAKYTVTANGGNILWSSDSALGGSFATNNSYRGLANGGTAITAAIKANALVLTTSGGGSVGSDTRPIQTVAPVSGSTANLTAGGGGAYLVDWGTPLTLSGATATGSGDIRVVTANVGGHNLIVAGNVKTATGNIYLASDDNLAVNAGVTIGGSGFSGTVWMQANRDQGTAGQTFTMNTTAAIVTSNTTNTVTANRTPATQAVYLDISGDTGTPSALTVGNITVGNGGRIVIDAIPNGVVNEAGKIVMAAATNVLSAGTTGTIDLNAAITAATVADVIGTSAIPVKVAGGNVVVGANFGNAYVTGTAATGFAATGTATVTQTTTGGSLNFSTTAGVLTVSGPITNAVSGVVNLTSTAAGGGVNIAALVGSATTGLVTINAGTNPATLASTLTLFPTSKIAVTAAGGGLVVGANGVVVGSGVTTNALPLTVQSGGVVSPADVSVTGTLTIGNLAVGTGGILRIDLNTPASFDVANVNGTVNVTGGTLQMFANGTLSVNDSFVIVNNDGTGDAVTGQFVGGTTVSAVNDPRYVFTINYAGGDGNDIVATVSSIVTTSLLDVTSGGVALFASGNGLDNNLAVTQSGGTYSVTDTSGPIALSAAAVAAGWSGNNTTTVSGPTAGITGLTFSLNSGADTLNAVDAGAVPLAINGVGTIAVAGTVASTASIAIGGVTNITGSGTGLLQAPTLNLTAPNGVGTTGQRVGTKAATIIATVGAGGLFLAEADGADVTATATGVGNVDISNTTGTLNVAGATSTVAGNIALSSGDAVTLSANLNAGSGTITIAANTDGAGSQGYDQKAASITTTNTTAAGVSIIVNTAGGGTGNAVIGQGSIGSNTGGGYTVAANGGSVLWTADPAYAAFDASFTGLLNGGSNTETLKAFAYNFTTGAAGSVGTDARPLQLDNYGTNGTPAAVANLTGTTGSGGFYAVGWDAAGSHDLTTGVITAQGAGGIRVATGNAGGHNLYAIGNISTGSGTIYLAADDVLGIGPNVTIGGAGFSGTVWLQANRDQGTAGQAFTMDATSAVVTSNTTNTVTANRTPATQAVYLDISGDQGTPSALTVGSLTAGDGGRIVVNAIPNGIALEAGRIIAAAAANVLNAGPTGTVELIAGITTPAAGDAVGTTGTTPLPVRVAGGNVVVNTNYGNVLLASDAAASVTVSETAVISGQTAGPPMINLTTTAGALTVATPLGNVSGGTVSLTGAAGVVLNAQLGNAATGAIAVNGPLSGSGNIVLGTGGLTVTQDTDSTFGGSIAGSQSFVKAGIGTLALTAANAYGNTSVSAGRLYVSNAATAGALTVADGATFGGAATVGATGVAGTLQPGGPGTGTAVLNTGDVSFGASGARVLAVDLNGTGYDQVNVVGSVDLTGATLTPTLGSGYKPALNTKFAIISNDGTDAVTGTFAGLAEGATFVLDGRTYTISYVGGDGNDVTLTVTQIAGAAPINTVPGPQSGFEDTDLVFSTANGNLISVADAGLSTPIKITITATHGVLTLSGTAGLSFTTGDGTADPAMTFTGSLASVNTALAGLRFTPDSNYNGTAAVSITSDDLGAFGAAQTDSDSVAVTLAAVNDVPSFTLPTTNVPLPANPGAQTLTGFVTGISAGPTDEAGQTLTFLVSNDNAGLFSVAPTISANGTLTFTVAAGASGTATVTVRLMDNGGTANSGVDTSAAQTFTIMVAAPTATTTAVTGNAGASAVYGTAITYTATVTAAGGTVSPTAGSVSFFDNGVLLGTATTIFSSGSGFATFTYTSMPTQLQVNGGAAHVITATYTPGSGFATSMSSGAGNFSQAITPASLTIVGLSGNNKTYDATTAATLNTVGAMLTGVFSGDTVSLVSSGATGTFANKNVGTGIAITLGGLSLSGTAAGNYVLTLPAITADITPASLTVGGVTAGNKVYDTTTTASIDTAGAMLIGVVSGDMVSLMTSGATGSFVTKNAGTNVLVTVGGVSIGGADAGNYVLGQPTTTATITPAMLTVMGVTANGKVYDATTTATLNTSGANLTGVLGSDDVGLNSVGTGTFATKNVGTGIVVTVNGLNLTGTDAGNYSLNQPTTTATITAAMLTVSGITAGNKVYDATTAAALDKTGAMLVGVFGGDMVTLMTSGATGAFSSKNVANGIGVTISGLTIGGTDSGNYVLTQPATMANITPATLTVTGVTAGDKVYDATTNAVVNASGAVLAGVLGSDTVSLDKTMPTGTFATKNVGSNIAVTVGGLAIGDTDAGNYVLTQPTTMANITPATLTVNNVTASDKVYDATTAASVNASGAVLVGVLGADTVGLVSSAVAGSFANKNAGTGIMVTVAGLTLDGTDAGNYVLTQPTTMANITPATLTANGVMASDKVYDATTTASITTGGASLGGVFAGDMVTILSSGAMGTFANKNVGTGVMVTVSGLSLGGTNAGNYVLTQPTTSANITPASLTVTGATASDKVYDATTTATINFSGTISGVLGSDNVSLNSGATGTFANKNVGTGIMVTVNGLTLSGTDAGNYVLTPTTTSASITPASLTVMNVTASDKVYDATTAASVNTGGAVLSGVLGADTVGLVSSAVAGSFANKNAGTGIMVTVAGLSLDGTDAGNYVLTQPTTMANIIPATLTITGVTAANKVYDATTAAAVNATTAVLSGVLGGDNISLLSGGATGVFVTKNAGTGITVAVSGLSLGGTDAVNYVLTQPTAMANITPRTLTVTGVTAGNKVYDATTAASVNAGGAVLSGVLGSDNVILAGSGATGTFASKNVGTGIAVTVAGLAIGGGDVGNYVLTQPTAPADITPATLTVTGVAAGNKVYDATTAAAINATGAILVGVFTGDAVTVSTGGATGVFVSKNVGASVAVAVSGLTIAGSDASNYVLTQPITTASITPKAVTVTGVTAGNKVYDATTAAPVNAGTAALSGVLGGDNVTLASGTATGTFATKNVGTGIAVTVLGLGLNGADAGNYSLTPPTAAANITPKVLTATGVTAADKVYDATTTATLTTGGAGLVGAFAGDAVGLVTSGATGSFATKNVGANIAVTLSGFGLNGADAGNYTLTPPTAAASIAPKALTVAGVTAGDKVYDGTTAANVGTGGATLTGVLGGDAITLNSTGATGAFVTKTAGTNRAVVVSGLTVGGADAGNYTLTPPTAAASIAPKALTVAGVTAGDKVYDGTTAANVGTGGATLTGTVAGDSVALNGGAATGTFATKNVGANVPVAIAGLGLTGADAGNYIVAQPTAVATITPRAITATGVTAADKVYDGTTAAAIGVGGVALSGVVSGDTVALAASGATGTFASRNAGANVSVTVNGLGLAGADRGNYTLTQPTAVATITPRSVALTGVAVADKEYDGTTAATLNTTGAVLAGTVAGDTVAVATATATGSFTTRNASTGIPVAMSGLTLTGVDASNYSLAVPTVAGRITPRAITVTAVANSRPFDGTTAAESIPVVTTGSLVTGDTATFNETYDTPAIGTGKTLTPAGEISDGNGGGNYAITFVPVAAGEIVQRFLAPAVTAVATGNGVIVLNADGSVRAMPRTIGTSFGGGVRPAVGDVNNDGVPDTVVGSGPGRATLVQIFDGTTGDEVASFQPFEASFTGGVFVTLGDLDGDGKADIIVTPDEGGGPRVTVYSGADRRVMANFFGIDDPNFRGGARAAVGDINGDGRLDLLVAAGFGGGPRVAGYDGASVLTGTPVHLFADFFVFEQSLRNGVYIASGDIDGDGFSDLIFGGGPGGGPRVYALSGQSVLQTGGESASVLANFFAGDPTNRGGVPIAVKDLDRDAKADLLTGSGPGAAGRVTAYAGANLSPTGTPEELFSTEVPQEYLGGVFVG
ncbi:YDG domain-containing protein [Limnoglobus roseus]|uniref:Beta-propeller repeat protein n=1 Tax=Limnoglobus roseus TaxID=2598579 RepID=A0A5C1AGH4_9BACT|nr:YDG domain-containing protein [Limnoglobus roseus]QEL17930.1 beta-propeller repeat protein [Limnoglobus roseus]